MRYKYVVLVSWSSGAVEQFVLGAVPLHIGQGEASSRVPIFAPDGDGSLRIGSLIVHGPERPFWTVSRVPLMLEDLERSLLGVVGDQLSENDARRLHALADYLTAHELLLELVQERLSRTDNWTTPGVIERNIDRARNVLQALSSSAHFLLTAPSDGYDLMALMRRNADMVLEPEQPKKS